MREIHPLHATSASGSLARGFAPREQGIGIAAYCHQVREDSENDHKNTQDLVLLRCYAVSVPAKGREKVLSRRDGGKRTYQLIVKTRNT